MKKKKNSTGLHGGNREVILLFDLHKEMSATVGVLPLGESSLEIEKKLSS